MIMWSLGPAGPGVSGRDGLRWQDVMKDESTTLSGQLFLSFVGIAFLKDQRDCLKINALEDYGLLGY